MIAQFTAVYEKGVLRPTVPIALPEGTQVEVVLTSSAPIPSQSNPPSRRPAEIMAEIAALPMQEGPAFSGREHDQVLYGGRDRQ